MGKVIFRNKKVFYQLIFFVLAIIFIIVFIRQFGKLSLAAQTLSQGSWYFLIAIAGIQVLGIANRGALYHSLYDFFGSKDSLKRLILLSLASNFVNLAAPAAGFSGMAIFVSEAERQGMSKGRALFVNFFAYFLIYGTFILILLFGLFYLMFNHQLYRYQIATASVLFGMILLLVIIAFVALKGAAKLKKLISFIARIINYVVRLITLRSDHSKIISEENIRTLSQEVALGLRLITKRWRALWLPVFHVVLMEAIDILTLYYFFLAFKYPIYPGTLIAVYAIGFLFALVSITPNGIGIVEATMIVVLTNLSVPVELAAIAVLGYRLFTFWIPFALGFGAFRIYQKDKIIQIENGSR